MTDIVGCRGASQLGGSLLGILPGYKILWGVLCKATVNELNLSCTLLVIGILDLGSQKNGNIAESALDHVYYSTEIVEKITVEKISNSSSDHLPIICKFSGHFKNLVFERTVTKRSLKNFTKNNWSDGLAKKNWSIIKEEDDLDQMVDKFSALMEEALNEVAPIKSFKIRSHHRFGLSDQTKKLMNDRDLARANISNSNSTMQKSIMLQK